MYRSGIVTLSFIVVPATLIVVSSLVNLIGVLLIGVHPQGRLIAARREIIIVIFIFVVDRVDVLTFVLSWLLLRRAHHIYDMLLCRGI